jgi:sigma-B regulation protein RsbU (phosphoserine phosphatase)
MVREGADGPELTMVVGDVTGHGVGSALLMTSVRAYLKAHLLHIADLAEVMNTANKMMCRDVAGSGYFITVFLLSYSPSTRRARWVSAGHNPAVFQAFVSSEPRELQGQDIPLGVDARWNYNLNADNLAPGILLLGTDGIWEAMDSDNAMFGKERLNKVLAECLYLSPQQVAARIFEKIDEFTGRAQVEDDRTVVIARLA